jgi:hypothetical protein
MRLDHEKPDIEQRHREHDEHDGVPGEEHAGIGRCFALSRRPIQEENARAIDGKTELRQKGDGSDTRRGTEVPFAVPQEQPYAQQAEYDPRGQDGDEEVSWPDETEYSVNAKGIGKQKPPEPGPHGIAQNEPAKAHVHRAKGEDAQLIAAEGCSPKGEDSVQALEH